MKKILLFVFSFYCFHFAQAQQCNSQRYQDTIFHSVTETDGIYFGTATPFGALALPQDLLLDFYEPANDTLTHRPLIVFQFGGGFTIGWRSQPAIPAFCNYFAKCGYAVASIDYRIGLNPLDTASTVRAYYRGVQDERSAIRYLCAHAQQYKFDTSLIILTGTSAGCFCAFANAFTTDANRPLASFGSLLEPNNLGCLDCSGNTDLGFHIPHIKAIVNQWGAIMDTSFIEATENTPVISFHGDQDNAVPYVYGYPFQLPVFPQVYGSVPIHERLTNLGITNVLHPLVGFGHEPELLNPQLNDTVYNYARPFLFELLKPHTSEIVGDSMACEHSTAHYLVANTTGSKYCWNIIGNGTIVSNNGNSIAVQWNDTGFVSVTVKELNQIIAEGEVKSFQTYVVPKPHAGFGYNATELHVAFLNLSGNAVNYHWNFGDGNTSTALNTTNDYTSGGTFTVTLIADNNFCADTAYNTITIDSCPVADITFQLTNHNAFFYSPATNTTSYFWSFGDGDSASVASPNVFHQYAQNGTYSIVLRVENQLGCITVDTLTLNVGTTGINDLENEIMITQSGNTLFINTGSLQPLKVELFDITGRLIEHTECTTPCEIASSNFSAGIYLLKVMSDHKKILKKIAIIN